MLDTELDVPSGARRSVHIGPVLRKGFTLPWPFRDMALRSKKDLRANAADHGLSPAISAHQIAATAEPGQPLRELVGNFSAFETLVEQLGSPAVIELGKPLPNAKYLPRKRRSCPATLLREAKR